MHMYFQLSPLFPCPPSHNLLHTEPPPVKLCPTLGAPLHRVPALAAGEVAHAALEHRHLGAEGGHAGGAHSGWGWSCLLHISRFSFPYQGDNTGVAPCNIFQALTPDVLGVEVHTLHPQQHLHGGYLAVGCGHHQRCATRTGLQIEGLLAPLKYSVDGRQVLLITSHVERGHATAVGHVHVGVRVLQQQHHQLLVLLKQCSGERSPAKGLVYIVDISTLRQARLYLGNITSLAGLHQGLVQEGHAGLGDGGHGGHYRLIRPTERRLVFALNKHGLNTFTFI